jgi:broad specificity phosphatase PhoE
MVAIGTSVLWPLPSSGMLGDRSRTTGGAPTRPSDPAGGDGSRPATAIDVLVLRHGQSEWNAVRRWQGSADSPLTDLGREQARRTGAQLGELGLRFAGPWSSDLARAGETASIIADVLGIGPVRHDARLREAHAGEWEGMTPDEIDAAYPGWLATHRRPPSFEPFRDVVARAHAALADIAAHHAGSTSDDAVLVVAHSGLIRTIVRHHGHPDSRIPNLGGVWLHLSRAEVRRRAGSARRRSTGDSTTTLAEPEGDGVVIGDLFDPDRIAVSGVDAPGEDPGEQTDDPDADRRTHR